MLFAQRFFAAHAQRRAANAPAVHLHAHGGYASTHARPAAAPRPPLRLVIDRREDGATCMAISGRMADVCAELNRLAGA